MSSVISGGARPLAVRVPEASNLSGLSERTIWRLIKLGDLRIVKIGRATLIPMSSIDELLQGGRDVETP